MILKSQISSLILLFVLKCFGCYENVTLVCEVGERLSIKLQLLFSLSATYSTFYSALYYEITQQNYSFPLYIELKVFPISHLLNTCLIKDVFFKKW